MENEIKDIIKEFANPREETLNDAVRRICALFNVSDSDDEESDYMKWWHDLSDHDTARIIIDSGVRKPIRYYDVKNLHARYR